MKGEGAEHNEAIPALGSLEHNILPQLIVEGDGLATHHHPHPVGHDAHSLHGDVVLVTLHVQHRADHEVLHGKASLLQLPPLLVSFHQFSKIKLISETKQNQAM